MNTQQQPPKQPNPPDAPTNPSPPEPPQGPIVIPPSHVPAGNETSELPPPGAAAGLSPGTGAGAGSVPGGISGSASVFAYPWTIVSDAHAQHEYVYVQYSLEMCSNFNKCMNSVCCRQYKHWGLQVMKVSWWRFRSLLIVNILHFSSIMVHIICVGVLL